MLGQHTGKRRNMRLIARSMVHVVASRGLLRHKPMVEFLGSNLYAVSLAFGMRLMVFYLCLQAFLFIVPFKSWWM